MNFAKTKTHNQKSSNSDQCDRVKVFCRLRPLNDECEFPLIKLISSTTLATSTEIKSNSVRRDCNYVFRRVFTSYSTQREVFEQVAQPLLEDLVNGKNGLLFTYGVTGSGKTFTLTGDQMNPGVIPTCIHTLFNSIGDKQAPKYLIKSDCMNGFEVQSESEANMDRIQETKFNNKRRSFERMSDNERIYFNNDIKLRNVNQNSLYSVFISYTEIYNNTVYDLLDASNSKFVQSKIIREDSQKNMYVNGIKEVEVKSAGEVFHWFHLGQKRKRIAHTLLNIESSRGHSIFNIRIVQLEKNMQGTEIPGQTFIKIGQLSLVDLAGSERSKRTNNVGARLKEASSINNSLMTLRLCLEILKENQSSGTNKLVPYRDSRLTLLFKNYFDGEGQVQMIVCINPSEEDYNENLQVLKFAEMTQEVKVNKAEPHYFPRRQINIHSTPKSMSVQPENITKRKAVSSLASMPRIPCIKLNLEDLEASCTLINKLAKCLQVRKLKGLTNKRKFEERIDMFKKRLLSVEYQSTSSKSEIRRLKTLLKKEKALVQSEKAKLETSLAVLRKNNCNINQNFL